MTDFGSPTSLFGESPVLLSAACGMTTTDNFLTFSPAMHVPHPISSAHHVNAETTLDHLAIMHGIQGQPRVAASIDAYCQPQRLDLSPMGTLYTDLQSRAYNELAGLPFDASNIPSSSSILWSPSSKPFVILPLLDHSTMYPEAASPKTLAQAFGVETVRHSYDEGLLTRPAFAESFSSANGPVSGQELLWGPVSRQQVRSAPVAAVTSNGESISNDHSRFNIDAFPPTPSHANGSFDMHAPNMSSVSNGGIFQEFLNHDRDWFTSLAQTFATDQTISPLVTPSLSTPGLTTSPYSTRGVGIESSGPSAPVSPDYYRRYATTSTRPTIDHSIGVNRTQTTNIRRERTQTARWLEDRTSGQPPGPSRTRHHNASLSVVTQSDAQISVPVQEGAVIQLNSWFRDESDLWRRAILDTILLSSFYLNNLLEPKDHGRLDPITAGHGQRGTSIYGVFVEKVGNGEWVCAFRTIARPCPTSTVFKRLERAVDHIRTHLDHRPFRCPGSCSHGTNCTKRFTSKQYLKDHLGRNNRAACAICHKVVLLQNLTRHHNLCHPHLVNPQ